jgi:hypothetical protein
VGAESIRPVLGEVSFHDGNAVAILFRKSLHDVRSRANAELGIGIFRIPAFYGFRQIEVNGCIVRNAPGHGKNIIRVGVRFFQFGKFLVQVGINEVCSGIVGLYESQQFFGIGLTGHFGPEHVSFYFSSRRIVSRLQKQDF